MHNVYCIRLEGDICAQCILYTFIEGDTCAKCILYTFI